MITVSLADRILGTGFLVEPLATQGVQNITGYGGRRGFLGSRSS
ncbi:hypothetical protein C8K30_10896 [Promicromonospora sp. AC04]|nr:hypothetical protein [Promicromonospora sp. AC04]PUB24840.1 hypothetical protein C8K30_10896 [Promicromonospora sp. AC04]